MQVRSRFRWSLVVALAVHACLTLKLRTPPTSGATAARSTQPTETDIEVEPPSAEALAPAAAARPSTAPAPARADALTPERDRSRPATAVASIDAPAGGAPEVPAAHPEAPADDSWTFSPTAAAPDGARLSVDALASAGRAGVQKTLVDEEKKGPAKGSLPKLFSDHELALGLVPGGRFVRMTSDKVRTSLVPDVSHAVLEFDTNAAGIVVSVRVLDVSSDRTDWDEVAAALVTEASTGRPERVPPGANGVAVVMTVTSTMLTASGQSSSPGALKAILQAVQNPADAIMDSKQPARRMVAAHIVDVRAL